MVEIETLFILGSGASKPYKFPTDEELRKRIIKDFRSDYLQMPYTSDLGPRSVTFEKQKRKTDVNSFIERLQNTEGTCTIDEFINVNTQFEFLGKVAIQYYLLKYEKEYDASRSHEYVSDWFEIVLREMFKDAKRSKNPSRIDSNSINFLTFNYDRIIEFLFIKQFVNLFNDLLTTNINKQQIGFFLYRIIHLYGSLGTIPQNKNSKGLNEIDFGEKLKTYEQIKNTINNIGLIKDGFKQSDRVSKKIYHAKKIFLLGIGYIKDNMKLLNLENSINYNDPPQIYGTAYNKSLIEISEIKNLYFNFSQSIPEPIIESSDCKKLIQKYFNK